MFYASYKLIIIVELVTTVELKRVPNVVLQSRVDLEPPRRPGSGSTGREIMLKANLFELNVPDTDLHHYNVDITPAKCPRFAYNEFLSSYNIEIIAGFPITQASLANST